jgi:murein L,D-transpeptidase YcbB/YkuD
LPAVPTPRRLLIIPPSRIFPYPGTKIFRQYPGMQSMFQPRPFRLFLLIFFLVWVTWPNLCFGDSLTYQVSGEIRSVLAGNGGLIRLSPDREIGLDQKILPDFYAQRDYLPAWVDDQGISPRGFELLEVLRDAAEEGLCPEDFHLKLIEPLVQLAGDSRQFGVLFDPVYMADLDLLFTDAFLLYASQISEGRVDPAAVQQGRRTRLGKKGLLGVLEAALGKDGPAPALSSLVPPHPGYALLLKALAQYRHISALGGWRTIPLGPVLRPGDRDSRVPLLRARLVRTGDLQAPSEDSDTLFDGAAEAALVRFQLRHGLAGDGVLGPRTVGELNVPVEARIRQIELNLERWRWLPRDLGKKFILVNIADFSLEVVEEGVIVMRMPVIVGTSYRKTPVFSGLMRYIEFAPYWGVPPTILREDKLPKIRANRNFLKLDHFEIVPWAGSPGEVIDPEKIDWKNVTAENFPGLLRQKPGPWNPLGRVKFIFPNAFDVYLHDTPQRYLFERNRRSYSSGCIRIERPEDLAQYLLEGQKGWDCERIADAMNSPVPIVVPLQEPLPVHILYRTAWVDEGGALQFRKDVYLRDADLDLALRETVRGFGDVVASRPPEAEGGHENPPSRTEKLSQSRFFSQ